MTTVSVEGDPDSAKTTKDTSDTSDTSDSSDAWNKVNEARKSLNRAKEKYDTHWKTPVRYDPQAGFPKYVMDETRHFLHGLGLGLPVLAANYVLVSLVGFCRVWKLLFGHPLSFTAICRTTVIATVLVTCSALVSLTTRNVVDIVRCTTFTLLTAASIFVCFQGKPIPKAKRFWGSALLAASASVYYAFSMDIQPEVTTSFHVVSQVVAASTYGATLSLEAAWIYGLVSIGATAGFKGYPMLVLEMNRAAAARAAKPRLNTSPVNAVAPVYEDFPVTENVREFSKDYAKYTSCKCTWKRDAGAHGKFVLVGKADLICDCSTTCSHGSPCPFGPSYTTRREYMECERGPLLWGLGECLSVVPPPSDAYLDFKHEGAFHGNLDCASGLAKDVKSGRLMNLCIWDRFAWR